MTLDSESGTRRQNKSPRLRRWIGLLPLKRLQLFPDGDLVRLLSPLGQLSFWTTEDAYEFIHVLKFLFLLGLHQLYNPDNLIRLFLVPPVLRLQAFPSYFGEIGQLATPNRADKVLLGARYTF